TLGRFNLVGIPPAPRGIPQIEVTFDIDANGILHVTAKDLGTGKEQKMTITAPLKMASDEIDRKIKDAEKFADEDKQRKEKVEVLNQADTLVYTTEKTLKELGDKVSVDQKQKVEKALENTKDAIKSDDVNRIKSAIEDLTKEMHAISTILYQQQAQQQQGQQQGQQEPQGEQQAGQQEEKKDETVTDAEYKVVDEDKK
ncbi:partial Chaperone protein DnaK, partial [Methanosarcinales archaeon]